MNKVYGLVNKRKWQRGIWHTEPDKLGWTDKTTALYCEIHRDKHFGFLRGFIYLPLDISFTTGNCNDLSLYVYGGQIYAFMSKTNYIIGFDCFLPCDATPGEHWLSAYRKKYKDIKYVINECSNLAKKIKEHYINGKEI